MADASDLKTISDGLSIWVPVASAFVGGIMAIAGGVITQVIIAYREQKARDKKLASDRAFIGAGLVLFLKEFRYQCNRIASDTGELRPASGGELNRFPVYQPLLPELKDVEGDWTVIPGALLLRVRHLPLSQRAYERYLDVEKEVHDDYPDHQSYYHERRARYRKLSDECTMLEKELRQLCGFHRVTIRPVCEENTE
ncbi:hypothetical protein UXO11_22375 [Enterobacter wuhouensis]|uniref:hypothetical protein n=1 Tax=Enterobacter wuhouensis TaxID=2529381 RepID=UPI002FD14B87